MSEEKQEQIMSEISEFCRECRSCTNCTEEDCILFRIERIIVDE